MTSLTIMIPGNPVTKKNSVTVDRRTGIPHPSKTYKAYEKQAKPFLPMLPEPIACRVNIKCIYWMKARRRVDLTNLLEGTDDILVKHGILQDDNCNIIVSHDGSRVMWDKTNPRAEITIEEVDYGGFPADD